MKLVITTNDVSQSQGFLALQNPVAVAFARINPDMENIQVRHNRLTATRAGYPVRFQISNFTVKEHQLLYMGDKQTIICELRALPIPATH